MCPPACQNGGNCTRPGVCQCPPSWTGDRCQTGNSNDNNSNNKNNNKISFYIKLGNGTILLYYGDEKIDYHKIKSYTRKNWMEFKSKSNIPIYI